MDAEPEDGFAIVDSTEFVVEFEIPGGLLNVLYQLPSLWALAAEDEQRFHGDLPV